EVRIGKTQDSAGVSVNSGRRLSAFERSDRVLQFVERDGLWFALEDFGEMSGEARAGFIKRDGMAKRAFERRGAFVFYAAWNYEIEVAEVCGDIECKTVRRDPAAKVHAQGGELFFALRRIDPDAMAAENAARGETVVGGREDHHLFELLDVPADVALVLREVENRIADDLAGAVVGDVAAAVCLMEFDVHLAQDIRVGEKIFALTVAPERDDVWVLAEEEHIRHDARFARRDDFALEVEGGAVGDAGGVDDPEWVVASHIPILTADPSPVF